MYFLKFAGLLIGVFDGHGGPACAQVISKRLLSYVAAALLPLNDLKTYVQNVAKENLLDIFNDKVSLLFYLYIASAAQIFFHCLMK